jgi:hypothetical protein
MMQVVEKNATRTRIVAPTPREIARKVGLDVSQVAAVMDHIRGGQSRAELAGKLGADVRKPDEMRTLRTVVGDVRFLMRGRKGGHRR